MASTLTAKSADAEEGRGCIFISYRREDAGGHVLALVPLLAARFGAERIFKDVDNIPAGQDFVQAVQRSLASCAVLLVVIGREWLTIKDARHSTRRLDDPDDMVRLEVATALQSEHVLVVPVLVGRATMPAAEDLPENLKSLARRNAVELSDIRWVGDTDRLIRVIDSAAGLGSTGGGLRAFAQRRYVVSAAAVFTLIAALGLWQFRGSHSSDQHGDQPVATTGTSSRSESPATPIKNPSSTTDPIPPAGPDPRSVTDARPTQTVAVGPKPPDERTNTAPPTTASKRPKPSDLGRTTAEGRGSVANTSTATPPTTTPSAPPSTGTTGQAATAQIVPPPREEPPPKPVEEDQRPAISAVIQRFRAAFNQKDASAMREVFPGAPIEKMFAKSKNCVSFTVDFSATHVTILSASTAKADVQATYSCQPNTKGKPQVSDPATDVFVLERRGPSWFINDRLAAVD
jgi:hypothetical protein